ncbi:hypothetical protein HYDPIDRAFT_28904 [Hydnomerulius pinastri MD-312]|uniref:DUF6534 domain-containing protein n=1 Tax=Hydnomerulius pinastri MD-312 TaxID=994086 RepID=A0A0C9VZW7_9AGAM|nr:hypothetical protein HYDPIDRAFT_28904 [Hydnomerulius pinastri MD-312]
MSVSPPPTSVPGVSALPFNVDNTLGALLVGGLFAAAFWGVTSAQTFIYFQRFSNDRISLKLFVAFLWVLDTFDACLTSHILYYYLVSNFMNPLAIAAPVWSVLVSVPFLTIGGRRLIKNTPNQIHVSVTSLTDVLIRSMFARRVWQLSGRNWFLTAIVCAISLCDLIVGITITVKAFKLQSFAELKTISTWLYISFGAGFLGDLFVAVVLCYYLFKSRTGFQRTDTLVNTLVSYIITTGLLTSIDAILGTLFYIVMPSNFIFIGFYFNLAKMYINSYLALLNAREHLREKSEGVVSIHLSRISDRPFGSDYTTQQSMVSPTVDAKRSSGHDLEINVETTVDRKTDLEFRAY